MNGLKKTLILLAIATFAFLNTEAQQSSSANQKIVIKNFKINRNDTQLIIDWETEGTVTANYWQLQSSIDGKPYKTFALVFGPDPRQGGSRFQYKGKMREADGQKVNYRLCPVDNEEKEINNEIIPAVK